MVIISSNQKGRPKLAQPRNREWAIAIQGINSQGQTVLPYIIVKGKYHLSSQYENSLLLKDQKIAISSNGWTTNELTTNQVKHFNKHTKHLTNGVYQLLILDGHRSYHLDAFKQYYKDSSILTLYMPLHSLHILQPLDVACFRPLKKAYSA